MRYILLISMFSLLLALSCRKEKKEDPINDNPPQAMEPDDATVYSYKDSTVFYYKDSTQLLKSDPASAHSPYFRVKFNAIAKAALTDAGKLPKGIGFPTGSIVVKELYDTIGSPLRFYAVMKKLPTSANVNQGWVWGEYEADGKVLYAVKDKGGVCVGCHATNSRDYVRLFDLFP
jgi:hypothetical protein